MDRNKEDDKYIRYLWKKGLPINKENLYLLKQLVNQDKIKLEC